MPNAAKKAASPAKKAAATKRKSLTPAERIAKAEAELEAIKKKAAADSSKKTAKLDERLKSLVTRRDNLDVEIKALEAEIARSKLPGSGDEGDTSGVSES